MMNTARWTYRPFLVATRNDILNWVSRAEPFKTALKTILREKVAFFVGLSAQDFNIQDQCCEASVGQATPFPTAPPKVYFAELEIGNSQRAVLKAIYGAPAYDGDANNIDAKAAVQIYAKTLFGSLYLLALLKKISLIASLPNTNLSTECMTLIGNVLQRVKDEVQAKYDGIADERSRWRSVADEVPYFVSRILSMYRRRQPPVNQKVYEPIGDKHLGRMPQAPHEVADLQWLIFALAVLREGEHQTFWRLSFPVALDGGHGQMGLSNGTEAIPVFLLRSDGGLPELMTSGFIDA
jgi:hypothetical protein